MLFLLKIAVTPLLVVAVSLAARWWGPTMGGLLMGLPWFTGPTLFVLIQEKGIDFGVAACIGIELGVVCVGVFVVVYGWIARLVRWPIAMSVTTGIYFASVWVMNAAAPYILPAADAWQLPAATGIAVAGLAVTLALLPRPMAPPALYTLPWWDIPMRMAATAALVASIVLAADALGPQLSGILGTYPVILTVVCAFTHHGWGADAVLRVLRGVAASLFSFVAFFLVVGSFLPTLGPVLSYVCALLVAVAMTSVMLFVNRTRPAR